MTKQEAIEQLEGLKEHCESFIDDEDAEDDVWRHDVQAIEIAIYSLKKDLIALPSYKN